MKSLIIGLALAAAFCSCTNGSDDKPMDAAQSERLPDAGQYPQQWQLIRMSGNMPDSETSGDEMAWQESYVLNEDQTFRKVRKQNGETMEASGTFAFVNLSDGQYLELTYQAEGELIGNCTGDTKELLRQEDANTLTGTWQACDGPGLVYERVK